MNPNFQSQPRAFVSLSLLSQAWRRQRTASHSHLVPLTSSAPASPHPHLVSPLVASSSLSASGYLTASCSRSLTASP
ncbi:uncharacterized protein DS421_19g659220 [Arachis hypogaea]|uniref:Uncharacterized protein n=1 Tax=Arachis hypogaea TaxID=3818 RepID=A0A6B9V8W2_ARAHY|nr:uncharacterized protein DS421_19g659220 [Arachis hypogaea]